MKRRRRVIKRVAHLGVFLGICLAAVLDRYFGAHDAALFVSIASNGFWIYNG